MEIHQNLGSEIEITQAAFFVVEQRAVSCFAFVNRGPAVISSVTFTIAPADGPLLTVVIRRPIAVGVPQPATVAAYQDGKPPSLSQQCVAIRATSIWASRVVYVDGSLWTAGLAKEN